MKLVHNLKFEFRHFVEQSGSYAVSLNTIMRTLGLSRSVALRLAHQCEYNVFTYNGETYIGTERARQEYYYDKLLGQNPFYQTC